MDTTRCHAHSIWKRDVIWSPRRKLAAVIARKSVSIVGYQGREHTRIKYLSLDGGLGGQKRIKIAQAHSQPYGNNVC